MKWRYSLRWTLPRTPCPGPQELVSEVVEAGQSYPASRRVMSAQYNRSRFVSVFKSTGRHLGAGRYSVIFFHSPPVNWIWPG